MTTSPAILYMGSLQKVDFGCQKSNGSFRLLQVELQELQKLQALPIWGWIKQSKWVFPKIELPPKWMVKIMENPVKMDDLGVPLFSETIQMYMV